MTEEKTQIADHFPSTAIQNNEIQFNFFFIYSTSVNNLPQGARKRQIQYNFLKYFFFSCKEEASQKWQK